jgi:hypothetical protein
MTNSGELRNNSCGELPSNSCGLETNLDEIAIQICSDPPRPPCSIQLIMAHEVENDIEYDVIRDFTMACLHTLWGLQATPGDLDPTRLELLQQYVRSVGYQLKVQVEETETEYRYHISFERYQSSQDNPYSHLKKYM